MIPFQVINQVIHVCVCGWVVGVGGGVVVCLHQENVERQG